MITSNVVHRTFRIRCGSQTGTAFAIDRVGRQYLVTARHVVEGMNNGEGIEILRNREWLSLPVKVVGIGSGDRDIAVFACSERLAPALPLEASSVGLVLGQQTHFLGFPFGWDSGGERNNHGYPIPLVKAGFVSSISYGDSSHIFLDAHGNKGFSGGPVVFSLLGAPDTQIKVAGVVAQGPRPLLQPVVDQSGKPFRSEGEEAAYFAEDQGLVVVVDINHVHHLIDSNPIGFRLPPEEAV